MSIERSFEPDLESKKVCKFLIETSGVMGESSGDKPDYSNKKDVTDKWTTLGFSKELAKTLNTVPMTRLTFIQKEFFVFSKPSTRPISKEVIYDHCIHECNMEIGAILFLRINIDPEKEEKIKNSFRNTDLNDVDQVELDLLRSGIDLGDFQISFFFELVRTKDKVTDERASEAFRNQMRDRGSLNTEARFEIEMGRIEEVCKAPDSEQNDEMVLEGDPDDPIEAIGADAGDNLKVCEELELISKTLGKVFWLPEFRTIWRVRKVKIGKCKVMKTKLPVFQIRENRQILVAYVATEKSIKALFEKTIISCIENAAIATGIFILITSGKALKVAKAIFVASALNCLEKRLADNIKCLKPDLKLVTERTDWKTLA